MRNFKEFLNEELDEKNLPYVKNIPHLDQAYRIESKKPNLGLLTATINKRLNIDIMIVPDVKRPEYYDIQVPFYNSQFNSRLGDLKGDMYHIIYNRYKQSNVVGSSYVNCINLPKFLVEWGQICIFVRRMNSLAGIHKVLNCEYLTVENMKSIKSNVLGILQIKNIDSFWVYGTEQKPEWALIIEKHLNIDKDLLDCKEELMSKGLKEYAKL
jgi:hypothetical protein